MDVSWSSFGEYTTDVFSDEVEDIIRNHDTQFPLFLYIAHLATHSPLEAPYELVDSFIHIKEKKRRIFAGNLKLVCILVALI